MQEEVEQTEAKGKPDLLKERKEPLFSKKNRRLLSEPLDDTNPITVMVLGICSALAITVQVEQAVVMTLSVMAVLAFGNVIISLLRNYIPNRIRIIVQLTVVAALVILVDQVLKAFVYDVSKALSVFVGLIITNCIIMGRLEAFALGNKPWPAFLDGIGNAAGYGIILIIVSVVRELFGSGKLYGFEIIPQSFYDLGYMNNNMMILPPMALIVVGIIIWVQRSRNTKLFEEN
ncbi:MAG: NADH:ubiquinone reductase (Na(+)-transporting) subunit D [Bacteroidota bacterium]